jgi:predicted transcriptional regulator of viral defense system
MLGSNLTYNYLEDYVNKIRSQGRYVFTWTELKGQFDISDKALNQALYRLKTKRKVTQIRKGFYAIITPEYSHQGMLPVNLFIDDMMKSLNKRYYVGLISAAALYGAAHQQPMEFFVVTEKPALRDIRAKKLKLSFYIKKGWSEEDIIQKKTDAGYINVSSPELTALDLLYYKSIGLNQAVTILKELVEEIKPQDLLRAAKRYPQVAAIQRLGYILDKELQNEKLSEVLKKVLQGKRIFPVPLSNDRDKSGDIDDTWRIIKNIKVESDI